MLGRSNAGLHFKLLNVWTLVDLPKDKWAIGTKWVFKNKKDKRGIVIKNKARLVARGHTQDEGIDYDEVFSPTEWIEDIRIFMAYASFKYFIVYQMDVTSAFLYEKIEKEVYVCQPPGFEDPDFPDKVHNVEKALYVLHQAPRAWFQVTPKTSHLYVVKRIFRYLKGQPKFGLWYPKDSPFDLEAYSDSDYARASLDRKSKTGEYVAVASCYKQLLWIQNQMLDYGFNLMNTKIYIDNGNETIYKEWEDRMERVATTASSLEAEQDSGNKNRTQSIATLIEPLPQGIGSSSGPRFLQVFLYKQVEGMAKHKEIYVISSHTEKVFDNMRRQGQGFSGNVTPLFKTMMVLDLEEAKIAQAKEIAKLKKRVKKLEKRRKSRPAGLRRLKKGRGIKDIGQDAKIALVDKSRGRMHDADMFGVDDLESNEVIVDVREKIIEKEVSTANSFTTAGEVVTAASVKDSVAPTTTTTVDVDDELTLEKTLIAIKAAMLKVISTTITAPRAKCIVFYE
nr:putative ribonuclease H-like domain-containing protein [Tanacetum cinerariifolium]